MHLVSYRGPGVAGGVSTGLQAVWEARSQSGDCWWFINKNTIERLSAESSSPTKMNVLDENLVAGHYRFCNEFLWPVLHDMAPYARYYPADRDSYHRFNALIAQAIAISNTLPGELAFVQDYQLALLPQFLKMESGKKSVVFWHIPWPRSVSRHHVEPLAAIAKALLSTEQIGFHTAEYAKNFLTFVNRHLPAFEVNMEHGYVCPRVNAQSGVSALEVQHGGYRYSSNYITRPLRPLTGAQNRCITLVRSCPLTIDTEKWHHLAQQGDANVLMQKVGLDRPFIISVDRADYTKGVRERFRAIDEFLTYHPAQAERVAFLQVCGRTRPGMYAFDEYWKECRHLAAEINEKWQTAQWQPIVWEDQKLSAPELAVLYRASEAMLITAGRDGLNLTAKEYVASQSTDAPGVLLLSTGTGAWQELRGAAVGVDITQPMSISESINRALMMDFAERKLRMDAMQSTLQSHSLFKWWHAMTSPPVARSVSEEPSKTRRVAAG